MEASILNYNLKLDGSVRICGDFKSTNYPALQAEQYPLPRIEDDVSDKTFSKTDFCQAGGEI